MALENPFKGLPRPAIYVTLAGGAAVTGWALYQHHKVTGSWSPFATSSSGSSATTQTTAIDPVTGLPYSQDDATDPITGLQYLAEAEEYGSVQSAEADVSAYGATVDTGSGVGVQPAYEVNGSPSGTQTGSNYTSNAAWATSAQAGLTDIGYVSTDVASALGLYLTGQPLTSAQASIVNAAIAEYGPPPVGTFQVILAPPSSPSTVATVPNVKGMTVAQAVAAITAAGLVPGAHSNDSGTVNGQTPGPGQKVAVNSKVDLSVAAAGTTGTAPTSLKAPGTPSVTPHGTRADVGWGTVSGAKAYELLIQGATGHDTGTSHYDKVLTTNHAKNVSLAKGNYVARVRAGASTSDVHGPWSSDRAFTIE